MLSLFDIIFSGLLCRSTLHIKLCLLWSVIRTQYYLAWTCAECSRAEQLSNNVIICWVGIRLSFCIAVCTIALPNQIGIVISNRDNNAAETSKGQLNLFVQLELNLLKIIVGEWQKSYSITTVRVNDERISKVSIYKIHKIGVVFRLKVIFQDKSDKTVKSKELNLALKFWVRNQCHL